MELGSLLLETTLQALIEFPPHADSVAMLRFVSTMASDPKQAQEIDELQRHVEVIRNAWCVSKIIDRLQECSSMQDRPLLVMVARENAVGQALYRLAQIASQRIGKPLPSDKQVIRQLGMQLLSEENIRMDYELREDAKILLCPDGVIRTGLWNALGNNRGSLILLPFTRVALPIPPTIGWLEMDKDYTSTTRVFPATATNIRISEDSKMFQDDSGRLGLQADEEEYHIILSRMKAHHLISYEGFSPETKTPVEPGLNTLNCITLSVQNLFCEFSLATVDPAILLTPLDESPFLLVLPADIVLPDWFLKMYLRRDQCKAVGLRHRDTNSGFKVKLPERGVETVPSYQQAVDRLMAVLEPCRHKVVEFYRLATHLHDIRPVTN